MLRRVRIKSVPQARTGYQVKGALVNDVPAMGGADYNAYIGKPNPKASRTLTAVPREEANLEAEGGETVVGNLDGSMMPSFKTIKGPRHTNGGVPLNLPDDSFIFSDTKGMKINDPHILKMFNKPEKKGGYTPAELSKKFDIQKYREILQNSDSDAIDRKTAELMIKNYTLKLGALALAQESKKGFPQGIPEIAKPYMEANGIAEEDLIPKEPEPQGQDMPQGEGMNPMMQGMNQAPTEMPNGEPVAMPQEMEEMSPEMMQGAPMAMYGMQMGGFNIPFYDDPNEMAYGGVPKYVGGGPNDPKPPVKTSGRALTTAELQERQKKQTAEIKKQKGTKAPEGYQDLGNNVYGKGTINQGADVGSSLGRAKSGTGAPNAAWGKTICAELSKGVTPEQLAKDGHGTVGGLKAQFKDCIKKGEEARSAGSEELDLIQLEPETTTDCPCVDAAGKPVLKADGTPEIAKKDPVTGKCLPCAKPPEDRCECKKSDGTVYDPGKDLDGNCKDCEETIPGDDTSIGTPEKQPAKWWLQDTVNTMGAFGDMMTNRKYMPWEARVDLEEPRPTFLDPTRELAAQSEQANIASQAAASFAGPQALNARLSQIQGQGAKGAADVLSRINNQNVNIANQFEANQVGVRNQENMLNQQMANRVYDKNVIANQQFDNSKRANRANMRQAYNTAVTNRAKTDALNQMYPNYQTDPSTGGMVNYTPTEKKVDPGADEASAIEFANSIMKYPEATQKLLWQQKYGKKAGGQVFQKGGFIYSVFPVITL